MLDSIKGVKEAIDIVLPPWRLAIIGDAKVGKSWFAATMPGTKFFLDFDNRAASLAGKSDVLIKTYVDVGGAVTPRAIAELEADIAKIKYDKTQGKEIPETFVIDSATYARKFTEAELIQQQSSLGRVIKVGSVSHKIGAGWDIINGNRAYMEYLINTLGELGNVICVFHTQDEKDNIKSTAAQKAYTGRVTIQPQYLSSVLSIFNDVWLLDTDYSGKRIVQTGISNEFLGSTTLKGLDPLKEEPDISKMIAKHLKVIGKCQTANEVTP